MNSKTLYVINQLEQLSNRAKSRCLPTQFNPIDEAIAHIKELSDTLDGLTKENSKCKSTVVPVTKK